MSEVYVVYTVKGTVLHPLLERKDTIELWSVGNMRFYKDTIELWSVGNMRFYKDRQENIIKQLT